MKKTLPFLFVGLTIFLPSLGFAQANQSTKPIPAAPPPVSTPNADPSVMDGIWKITWNDPSWPYGSVFELQSGKVGGVPYSVSLEKGQPALQGPGLPASIPLQVAGNGTWKGSLGSQSFSVTPLPKSPATISADSANGKWSCQVYGGKSSVMSVSNNSVSGWGEGAGTVQLEPNRLVAVFPNGSQFWLYYISPDEWLGFGKFPDDELSYRPAIWKRAGK